MRNLPGYKSHEELVALRQKRKKPRMPAVPTVSEDTIHAAIIQTFGVVLDPRVRFWHTPNGGSRNKIEAAKFQRLGVLPGVSDITILWDKIGFIEIKSAKGTMSGNQEKFEAAVTSWGHPFGVARSVQDALWLVSVWGVPTRASLDPWLVGYIPSWVKAGRRV